MEIYKEFLVVTEKNNVAYGYGCDYGNYWCIDDCIVTEINEYLEDGECCFGE